MPRATSGRAVAAPRCRLRPTRVQVDYPTGSGLAIDAAAEAGAFGQVRSTSVSTLATSYTQAEAIGAALLAPLGGACGSRR